MFQNSVKRMSKTEAPNPLSKEFLDKHKNILDDIKKALNFIEPNYNDDDDSDDSGSSHSSYESSSSGSSDSDSD